MRGRITLLVAATTSVVLLAFLLPAASLVARVAEARALDAGQAQLQFLLPSVGLEDRDRVAADLAGLTGATRLGVLWTDGTTWLGEPGSTTSPPASPVVDESAAGTRLVQPVDRPDGTAVIEVLVPSEQLRAGVARTWAVLTGLGIALLGLALVVADRLARSLTRPVTDLASTAHRLGGGDLTARATVAGPPEVREVGEAVNRLADRIGELLLAEREAAADLAHRLRTPLTALRLDAEGLPAAERARIRDDVDALGRTVDAVIAEARRPLREGLGTGCDASTVVTDRVAFWSVLAEDEGRALRFTGSSGALPVRVPADDLAAAVDALLGNVFQHTPEGTPVGVEVRVREGGGALVTVADGGPGLDAAELLARGRSGGGSTGLGLDIARRTAEASGGRLHVSSSPAGTRVTLDLAPPS
ncbi:HAMP domain-containing histidine kinase [Blastococcus sp. MG754426]|uniref:sensor histidine kinase n=1 Tax=unclassified Blastococcus TaxID=2619396 RepID=UPI001EF0CE0B|nr:MULTISPECIES: HAMP domain-containing sensor histidine kinase [unclassified Blastococcus]MCF6505842.1 HAMP domain-containing histidine kinase [Blastococcus sp. MG754426]MCF6511078.1 HAMP domain-containing histidine kinase [Blastococcus sp. MG754427]MCF6734998.1 HAMP domain-containing histidine kinase [Blastococcus sp. KM273129]